MLSVVEGRVLGCLLEKERTTPDQYPLSLNALVLACNQTTARDPVMTVDPHDAEAAIASMKAAGLARLVHPAHGRSVTRFRQVADEHHGWTPEQSALLAVLLLRGPQTVGELRSRTERLCEFASVDVVERVLEEMAARPEPFVQRLERVPGQKEIRWQQLVAEEATPVASAVATPGRADAPVRAPQGSLAEKVADLEARIARIEAAISELL
jgi:uncharacterized protein YceH (UPF0502 family)